MKKFGTPTCAGPGNVNDIVGFDGAGTAPSTPCDAAGWAGDAIPEEAGASGCDRLRITPSFGEGGAADACRRRVRRCALAGAVGLGLMLVALAGAGVDAVIVGGAPAGDWQDSATDSPGTFTGNAIEESGVPSGTSTENKDLAPPAAVTVTRHVC